MKVRCNSAMQRGKPEPVPTRSLVGNVLQTTEFTLQLTIEYKLTDRVTAATREPQSYGTTEFFVGGDLEQDEQQAIRLQGKMRSPDRQCD